MTLCSRSAWPAVLFLAAATARAECPPTEYAARLKTGIQAQHNQQYPQAAENYRRAAECDAKQPEPLARLGIVLQELGRVPEATQALERALALDPNLPGVPMLLALAYQSIGENKKAIPLLDRTLREDPRPPMRLLAGQKLVDSYFASAESERALAIVEELRKLAPEDPDVLYTASKVYANLWNNAIQKMIKTSPGSYRVHQVLAEVFETQERFADAAKEYAQILRMEPNLPGAHYRLGRMLLRAGAADAETKALDEFQKELAARPFDVPALVEVGGLHLRAQRLNDAASAFDRALAAQPNSVKARVGAAKVLLAQKNYPKAIAELEKARTLAPEEETVHYNLMIAYRSASRAAVQQRAYADFQRIKTRNQQQQANILQQLKGLPGRSSESQP